MPRNANSEPIIASWALVPRSVVRTVRLAAAIGSLSLALTGELEIPILGVFLTFFILGLRTESFQSLSRNLAKMQPLMAAVVLIIAIIDFFYLSRSFLITVANFLLLLQALRLLALTRVRENVGSILLSSLMVLSSATLAVEWSFFLMLLLFLPTVIWAIILLNLTQENYEALEGADKNIEAWHRILGDRSPLWRSVGQGVRFAASTALITAILVCTIVFITFPRFNFQGFRGRFLQPVQRTGFTNEVNLDKQGTIYEDDSVVMRVEVDPKQKDLWPGYLRGGSLADFDGKTWRKSRLDRTQVFRNQRGDIDVFPPGVKKGGPLITYTVYLESMDSNLIFVAPWAVNVNIERPNLIVEDDGGIYRRPGDSWRVRYTATSQLTETMMDRPEGKAHNSYGNYLKVDGVSGLNVSPDLLFRIRGLAQQIVKGDESPLIAAQRISTYLSSNYGYTLNIGNVAGQNPLERFLFDRQKGHCEYFASSMCALLRSVGVQCRVVTGFVAHEWNPQGNYYLVRMRDAHAWTEVFIPGKGWAYFDPTPRSFESEGIGNRMANRFSQFMDFLNLQWNRYVLSYDMEKQLRVVRSFSTGSRDMSERFNNLFKNLSLKFSFKRDRDENSTGRDVSRSPNWVLGLGFCSVLFLGGLVLFRGRRKKNKIWFYGPLLKSLERLQGKAKEPGITLREFIVPFDAADPAIRSKIHFLSDVYYRVRFDENVSLSEVERNQIDLTLAQIRALKKAS